MLLEGGHMDRIEMGLEFIPGSSIRLQDDFMQHVPCRHEEQVLKDRLKWAIEKGMTDFYRPVCDPSFTNYERKEICYTAGAEPAVGSPISWWVRTANQFCPERGSRLGTESEYLAFLGILIKRLTQKMNIAEAWNAVCYDSNQLGNYSGTKKNTGSINVCGFFDLGNTKKILTSERGYEFCFAGGCWQNSDVFFPLSNLAYCSSHLFFDWNYCSVGWIVLEK